MNENISSTKIHRWAQELGLREVITDIHGSSEATHHRGSVPIDGIFASTSLIQIDSSDYLPFGFFMSDHRLLWMDVPESSILGFNLPPLLTPKARKLQCGNPRISNKWNSLYTRYIKEHNLHSRVFQLEASSLYPLEPSLQLEYESIMNERRIAIAYADKHCRHVRAGGVPFSPTIQKQRHTIELWEGVATRMSGNVQQYKGPTAGTETNIQLPFSNTIKEVKANVKQAYVDYYKLKKEAHRLRETHLERLAEAIAEEKDH